MYKKIIGNILALTFLILFQQPHFIKNELTERNKLIELRNLGEEWFGVATLQFDSVGIKNLVNVENVSKDKLSIF